MDKLRRPIGRKHRGMPKCISGTAEDTIRREEREIHARSTGVGGRGGEALPVGREGDSGRRRLRRRRRVCAHPPPLGCALFCAAAIVRFTLERLDRCKRKGITGKMEVLRQIVRVIWPREGVVYGTVRALVENAILARLLTQRSHEL